MCYVFMLFVCYVCVFVCVCVYKCECECVCVSLCEYACKCVIRRLDWYMISFPNDLLIYFFMNDIFF